MKCIIAGSRGLWQYCVVEDAVAASGWAEKITLVISGGARGVDQTGERWAQDHGIPVKLFVPDWNGAGKQAGFLRNVEMADEADALLAVWDGRSRGTAHMIGVARRKNLKVYVYNTALVLRAEK